MKLKFLLLISLILFSCGEQPVSYPGVCRHNALYTATIMVENYPTRIAVGRIKAGDYIAHVQTRAYINGKWEWIVKTENGAVIGKQEYPLIEQINYKLPDYVNWLSSIQIQG